MDFKPPYTDETLMLTGEHKFTRLSRVPAKYLLDIYKRESKSGKHQDKELFDYIEKNLDKIKDRLDKPIEDLNIGISRRNPNGTLLLCNKANKIVYASDKIAKEELKRIRKNDQKHKKPIQTYSCEFCGGWHTTSMTLEEWKNFPKK